jgi:dienelactone hydrolase
MSDLFSLISGEQMPVAGYGNMMQEYTLNKVKKALAKRRSRLDNVKSKTDAQDYVKDVYTRLKRCFGELSERTPLNAQVTAINEFDGIRIENIIFESRPGIMVTANLYLPLKSEGRIPGVIVFCGHTYSGKDYYQFVGHELARCGYAGLIVDPYGQGERCEMKEPLLNAKISPGSCTEHTISGTKLTLLGEFLGTWFLWDGIRAIDYLISRPEIDPYKIGITGSSGGGTQTSYVGAFDSRPAFAAPSCYITSIRNTIENERIPDAEQIPPEILANGLDYADFLIAGAPRPVTILTQDNDFVDLRGAEQAYEDIRKIYGFLGIGDKIKIFRGSGDHCFSPEHRKTMIEFFNNYSGLNNTWEKQFQTIPSELLFCTPNGNTSDIQGAKTLETVISESAKKIALNRRKLNGKEIKKIICEKLKFNAAEIPVPYYRNLRPTPIKFEPEMFLSRFALEVDPGIIAVLAEYNRKIHAQIFPEKSAILYIPNMNLGVEFSELKKILTDFPSSSWYGLNVRGKGECRSLLLNSDNLSYVFDGIDYRYSCTCNMLGEPYLKWQLTDIVATVKLLKKQGVEKLHLVGCGQGTVAAVLATLVFDEIDDVILFNAPESWQKMIENPEPEWPLSCMLPGILKDMDLPDIYQALNGRIQIKQQ